MAPSAPGRSANAIGDGVDKALKTKQFSVGDQIYLQSGETCDVSRKATTQKGLTLYMLVAKTGSWRGDSLWLTERELFLNVA